MGLKSWIFRGALLASQLFIVIQVLACPLCNRGFRHEFGEAELPSKPRRSFLDDPNKDLLPFEQKQPEARPANNPAKVPSKAKIKQKGKSNLAPILKS